MGSVVQEAARGMIHQLGGIQVLRLASILYLFATAVATAVARPIRPSIAAASGRVRTGLPEDYAPALARTADGYLWIGTNGGLWA
jgi:ligand-binding sensor domain-containing protein